MPTTHALVIGAGQAGLAVSRCLTEQGREHVVLDRGRVGQRWRSNSWDSLHLLTPNWMNTLPGETYAGRVPDGFASAAAFVEHLAGYAESFGAPVEGRAAVRLLRKRGDLFEVVTQRAVWRARSVVIATGWCDLPAVPAATTTWPPASISSRRATTASRAHCRTAACWSSEPRRPACNSPTSCRPQGAT